MFKFLVGKYPCTDEKGSMILIHKATEVSSLLDARREVQVNANNLEWVER